MQQNSPAIPCLQNVGANQATVLWTTRESFECSAVIAATSNLHADRTIRAQSRTHLPADTQMPTAFTLHRVDFTGLEPDTVYYYAIYSGNQNLTPFRLGVVPFRTAQRPGTAFRFLVLGDSGLSSPEQIQIAGRMEKEENVGFVIHVGDIVYPVATFADFETNHFQHYRNLMPGVPFFPCLGNHDVEADQGSSYLANHVLPDSGVTGRDQGHYYSFDWSDAHFVSLDSNLMKDAWLSQPMLDWLERDLARTQKLWKIVYFHHTPYDVRRGHDMEEIGVRERLLPILDRYGVQLVLAGHHHSYQRTVPVFAGNPVEAGRGTVYVTSGGAGALLYSDNNHPFNVVGLAEYHYMRFDVRGEELTAVALAPDGRELDRFTMQATPTLILDDRRPVEPPCDLRECRDDKGQ